MVLLGTLRTSFEAMSETSAGLPLWIQPQIGDKPGLESCVGSQVMVYTLASFRLKVAKIHDMYMAQSGGNMCEEYTPAGLMIYSNSRVLEYGRLGNLCGT
jgi:hypothetical protein